ncbi:MAG TPA: hypothetical protein VIK91_18270 [Nannocystis sp.]
MREIWFSVGLTAMVGCDLTAPESPPEPCGGSERISCPYGHTCELDPTCVPTRERACEGICVPTQCGGIAAFPCAKGLVCVDDPRDDCDPKHYGADCIGICVPDEPSVPSCDDPSRSFVATDKAVCDTIQILCAAGWTYFHDECGCGCRLVDG